MKTVSNVLLTATIGFTVLMGVGCGAGLMKSNSSENKATVFPEVKDIEIYADDKGCEVSMDPTGGIYSFMVRLPGDNWDGFTIFKDLSSGEMSACSDKTIRIAHEEVSAGTKITLSCDETSKLKFVSRGKLHVIMKDGQPKEIKIFQEVRRFLGLGPYATRTDIECSNLKFVKYQP